MATLAESQSVLRKLSPTQEKVDLAVKAAIEIAHPSRVYLFGSWPRGEALPQPVVAFSQIEKFAVVQRYGEVPQAVALDRPQALENVRILREHVVARIAALSATP